MATMRKIKSEYYGDTVTYNHLVCVNPLEHNFPVHTHGVCELIFLKSGNVSGIINAKTYQLAKNCLMIFRPHVPHRIQINDNTEYERYDILFDESVLANQIFFKLPKDLDLVNCNGNNFVIDLFKKLDYYYEHFDGNNLGLLVTNLVEELLFHVTIMSQDEFNSNLIATNPMINNAIKYINTHYTEQISIEDVSKHLCITKSYLHHLFMQNLQISPKKYINMKRLFQAQKLIRMGEHPSNVYLACGFNDYSTFFRNYHLYLGHNPSQENEVAIEKKIES